MALISCPECRKEISNKSKSCIHCGFPLAEYNLEKRYSDDEMVDTDKKIGVIIGALLVLVLLIIVVCVAMSYKNEKTKRSYVSTYYDAYGYAKTLDNLNEKMDSGDISKKEYDEEIKELKEKKAEEIVENNEVKIKNVYTIEYSTTVKATITNDSDSKIKTIYYTLNYRRLGSDYTYEKEYCFDVNISAGKEREYPLGILDVSNVDNYVFDIIITGVSIE